MSDVISDVMSHSLSSLPLLFSPSILFSCRNATSLLLSLPLQDMKTDVTQRGGEVRRSLYGSHQFLKILGDVLVQHHLVQSPRTVLHPEERNEENEMQR